MKAKICKSIVSAIRYQSPRGRFLERDTNLDTWKEVGDKRALNKTSQALRDHRNNDINYAPTCRAGRTKKNNECLNVSKEHDFKHNHSNHHVSGPHQAESKNHEQTDFSQNQNLGRFDYNQVDGELFSECYKYLKIKYRENLETNQTVDKDEINYLIYQTFFGAKVKGIGL